MPVPIVLAILFSLTVGGCAATVRPQPAPAGKALVKVSCTTPDGWFQGCGHQLTVCDVDGAGRPPEKIEKSWSDKEVNDQKRMVVWFQGFILDPGRRLLRIENNRDYCADESRWKQYVGGAILGGVGGAVFPLIFKATEEDPVFAEIHAEPGKVYVIDCDYKRKPWAWITAEDQR